MKESNGNFIATGLIIGVFILLYISYIEAGPATATLIFFIFSLILAIANRIAEIRKLLESAEDDVGINRNATGAEK